MIRVATGCRSLVSNTGLPAQDLRRLAVSANERAPHVITAREAALAGDVVDRIVPLLRRHVRLGTVAAREEKDAENLLMGSGFELVGQAGFEPATT